MGTLPNKRYCNVCAIRSQQLLYPGELMGRGVVVVAGADPGIDDFSLGTPAAHHIVNRAQAAWAPSS